jgi:hypothetical protein
MRRFPLPLTIALAAIVTAPAAADRAPTVAPFIAVDAPVTALKERAMRAWCGLLLTMAACGSAATERAPATSGGAAAPASPATFSALVHKGRNCGDARNGISGFVVYEVASGPRCGAQVIRRYGNADLGGLGPEEWAVAEVTLAPTTPNTGWPNACTLGFDGVTPRYDGALDRVTAYPDEATARAACGPACR